MGVDIKKNWLVSKKNDDEWLKSLKHFPDASFLNDVQWANHLENFGWKTLRLTKGNELNNKSHTLVQAFVKFFPFSTAFIWIPGGILGDYSDSEGLQKEIKNILKVRFCIIRMRCPQLYNISSEIELLKKNWVRPIISISSNFKVLLKIHTSIKEIRINFSRNWERSLKKGYKNNIKIIQIKSYKTIAKIYNEMKSNKGLKQKDIYSEKECKSIFEAYGEKLLVLGAQDRFYKISSIRGVIIWDGRMYDIFAATNKNGRLTSSSHLVLFKLLEEAVSRECFEYDLSNIDPENSLGVYNFKKGTGGNIIHTLGEFEWTNSKVLKFLLILYCKFKKK